MIYTNKIQKTINRLLGLPEIGDIGYNGSILYILFDIPTNIDEVINKANWSKNPLKLKYTKNMTETIKGAECEEVYKLTCSVDSRLNFLGIEYYKDTCKIYKTNKHSDKRDDLNLLIKKQILEIANKAKNKGVDVLLNNTLIYNNQSDADSDLTDKITICLQS